MPMLVVKKKRYKMPRDKDEIVDEDEDEDMGDAAVHPVATTRYYCLRFHHPVDLGNKESPICRQCSCAILEKPMRQDKLIYLSAR